MESLTLPKKVKVKGTLERGKFAGVAQLRGKTTKSKGVYLYGSRVLLEASKKKKTFELSIPIVKSKTGVVFSWVDDFGNVETEEVVLIFDKSIFKEETEKGPVSFNGGVGLTYVNYQQTGIEDVKMIALTGKINFGYLLSERWDFGANLFFTMFGANLSGDEAIRFLGINFRFGYLLLNKAPWGIKLMGGYYYLTTFVQSGSFGFTNMAGPQLFPLVYRSLEGGDSLYAYAKFSPVTNGISLEFLSLKNQENAIGFGWVWNLEGGNKFAWNLDVARLTLAIPVTNRTIYIESTSYTLGVTYGF